MSSTNEQSNNDELPSYVPCTEAQKAVERTNATSIKSCLTAMKQKGLDKYQTVKKERIVVLKNEQNARPKNKKRSSKTITNLASSYASREKMRTVFALLQREVKESWSDRQLLADELLRCQQYIRDSDQICASLRRDFAATHPSPTHIQPNSVQRPTLSDVPIPLDQSHSNLPPLFSPAVDVQLHPEMNVLPSPPFHLLHDPVVTAAPHSSLFDPPQSYQMPVFGVSAISPQSVNSDLPHTHHEQQTLQNPLDSDSASEPIDLYAKEASLPQPLYSEFLQQERVDFSDDVQYDMYPPEA